MLDSTSTVGGGEGQQLQTPHDHGLVQAAISGELTTLHHEKHHVGNCNIQFYGCGDLAGADHEVVTRLHNCLFM